MKTNITIPLLTVCGALAFSAGCGGKEGPTTQPANNTRAPADAAAAAPQRAGAADTKSIVPPAPTADAAADTAKAELLKQQEAAAKLATEKAATAATQEQGRIQSLLETVKTLTAENKYAEALKVIGELSKLTLSPEQQAVVDGLKKAAEQQAAQAATDKADAGTTQAIGDALGVKP